jgi:hypothetical protein
VTVPSGGVCRVRVAIWRPTRPNLAELRAIAAASPTAVDLGPKTIRSLRTVESPKLVSSAVLVLLLPQLGCGRVLGIEEKRLVSAQPVPSSTTCTLTAETGTALRIMNAIPGSPQLDLCHKPSTATSFASPWFAGSAGVCGVGVAYTQFTRNLAIEPGTYDFKLVPAGQGCDADGIEGSSITIATGSSVTLMAYGPTLSTGRISYLPNRIPSTDSQPVRFVHALNNADYLAAGMRSTSAANTLVTPSLFAKVEFGKAAPSTGQTGAFNDVDELGYVTLGGPTVPLYPLQLGVQQWGDDQIMMAAPLSLTRGHVYTIFALGTRGELANRPRIWSCDESSFVDSSPFLTCGNPDRIAIEVFDPNVPDLFTSLIAERTGPAISAIQAEDTDLLCLVDIFDPRIVDKLKKTDSSEFASVVFSRDIPASRVTSLTRAADGNAPVYPATACTDTLGTQLKAWLNATIEIPGCTTADPENPGEHLFAGTGDQALACAMNRGELGPTQMVIDIQTGNTGGSGSCYWCAVSHLEGYESFEHTMAKCTDSVPEGERPHLAFGGKSGLAVFSRKHALGEPELVLLPSSGWQRAAMRVPVTAENGTVFDYWCTSIRFPNTEAVLSYAGPYGTPGKNGSAEEQSLQIADAVEIIERRARETGTPAIVGVVAHTGPELIDPTSNQDLVYPFVPANFAQMGDYWTELVAADYTPACTFCGDPDTNPLNTFPTTNRYWTTHLFGVGILPDAVESTRRTFMDRVFDFTDATGNPAKGPVSQHYGLRSVVRITQ